MRTRTLPLLMSPLLLLVTACADQPIVAPQHASFASSTTAEGLVYEVIALGGGNGSASAISDAGIAVGTAREAGGTGQYPALRWQVSSAGATGPEELGSLPPPFDDAFSHRPEGINGSGLIVGHFNHNNRPGAFVYSDASGMQLLPRFVGSTYRYYAHAVSDVGIAVGFIEYAVRDEEGTIIDRLGRAAVWANVDDEPILLPPLAGHLRSFAGAINNDGLVLGSSSGDGSTVGVVWKINEVGELLEGPYEIGDGFLPWAVNDQGDIVGLYSQSCQAALIRAGVVTILNPLAAGACTYPRSVSDAAADGTVRIAGSSGDRPALWIVNADRQVVGPVDLGSESGKRGAYASAVNVHGWVVGGGRTPHGDIPLLWLPKTAGDDGDGGTCTHPQGKCK
jgi:hypothetical protein